MADLPIRPLIGQLSNQLREDLARLAELEPILPVTLGYNTQQRKYSLLCEKK